MKRIEYFDINANNINNIKSIYVNDDNKDRLTKILASNFTKNLEELDLSGCYNLKGVLPVAKCKNLKKVNITKTQIKNIESLKKCLLLEELILDCINCDITIYNLPNLIKIEINMIYEYDFVDIHSNPKLEIIKINNCATNKNNLYNSRIIIPSLKELYITHMNINTDHISINTNNFINLTKLRLFDCYLYFNNKMKTINLTKLEKLELIDCYNIRIPNNNSNEYIKIFSKCTNIKFLAISYINYHFKIDTIDDILCFTNLEELHLDSTNIIFTQETFDKLNTLKNLNKVYVYGTPDKKINFIPKNIKYEFNNDYLMYI